MIKKGLLIASKFIGNFIEKSRQFVNLPLLLHVDVVLPSTLAACVFCDAVAQCSVVLSFVSVCQVEA